MSRVTFLLILLFCLVCIKEVVAQSDSVRFYMKIDSVRSGIRTGQDVVLRYICTVQYDSVLPPRFNAPVEMMKEAVPHRTGHAVVNGELTELYEVGFQYIIRFETEGLHDLPLSVVKVNGKEYQTPPMSVWVKPSLADIDGVECSISVQPKHPHRGERFIVILNCNRQPDSKIPAVTFDGKMLESSGNGYSATNDTEEFRFMYGVQTEERGGHIVSVENLSFGGIPYTLPDTEIQVSGSGIRRMADGTSYSIWGWIAFAVGYLLLTYLALWLRFRKEANEELSTFVLIHHRLNLNTEWAHTHYGFPLTLLMIPVIFTAANLYAYITGDGEMFFPFFWCGLLPLVLAYISYRNRHSKLNFVPIATALPVEQIQQAVVEIAARHDWIIDYMGDDCFVAHTSRSFPSLSWGEQVFVVFDKGQVWVNSVNDMNKKSVACSFGYTKKNIRLLREHIEAKQSKPNVGGCAGIENSSLPHIEAGNEMNKQ